MCGIVGVLGQHEVAPILVEALKRLEYRGYDSAGIATINKGALGRRRATGKLINLSDTLVHQPLAGKTGIGHTRWATHGAPSIENAHPHMAGPVAIVHNGIIENFRVLAADLRLQGYECETETDTEVAVMLTRHHMQQGLDPVQAAFATIDMLEGAFALAFVFDGHDDLMIAARKGSPLAIGHGTNEMYVGSDAIALAPLTHQITYLEDGDRAILTRKDAQIYDADGKPVTRPISQVHTSDMQIDKGGYKHFMAKEIAQQPIVLSDALAHYISASDEIILPQSCDFSNVERLILVACGTAYYACLTAKYWLETIARIPVEVDVASEFRYREPPIGPGTMALFVSQSGETADTLAALRYCKGKTDQVISIVNVPHSSIARESDLALQIFAGVEIGVASTKAFTCQLLVLLILTLKAAQDRDQLDAHTRRAHIQDLRKLPGLMNAAISGDAAMARVATRLSEARDVLFLGRGTMHAIALEAALKLKETSYIHAEAYAAGELKHGPIALIDPHVPVVILAPPDALFNKTISNMHEVIARQGKVVLISDSDGLNTAQADVWHTIEMPQVPDLISPIVYSIPAQLLAYHAANAKGTDMDQPRNLAKSVTVE